LGSVLGESVEQKKTPVKPHTALGGKRGLKGTTYKVDELDIFS